MRHVFDYIIIDTPPLGSVIDAAVVAKQCDGTILVIEDNAVSYRFAQRVKDQLDKAGAKMLGVVLNKVDLSGKGMYGHYGSYYGRYYGRYYGKYYGNYGEDTSGTSIAAVGAPPRRQETATELPHRGAPDRELDELDYIEGVVRKD